MYGIIRVCYPAVMMALMKSYITGLGTRITAYYTTDGYSRQFSVGLYILNNSYLLASSNSKKKNVPYLFHFFSFFEYNIFSKNINILKSFLFQQKKHLEDIRRMECLFFI